MKWESKELLNQGTSPELLFLSMPLAKSPLWKMRSFLVPSSLDGLQNKLINDGTPMSHAYEGNRR